MGNGVVSIRVQALGVSIAFKLPMAALQSANAGIAPAALAQTARRGAASGNMAAVGTGGEVTAGHNAGCNSAIYLS